MSDEIRQTETDNETNAVHRRGTGSRRLRRTVAALALLGVGALGGGLGMAAFNASAFGGHGFGGHRGGEHMAERVRHKVSWMLASVDATEDQESRVDAIVSDAVERLLPLRTDTRATRHEFMTELLRTDINRSKLEELRRGGLDLFDRSSAIMVDAVAEAASVLTPEQREELLSKHRRFRR